jgi:hypothetical protein
MGHRARFATNGAIQRSGPSRHLYHFRYEDRSLQKYRPGGGEPDFCSAAACELSDRGYKVIEVGSAADALAALAQRSHDVCRLNQWIGPDSYRKTAVAVERASRDLGQIKLDCQIRNWPRVTASWRMPMIPPMSMHVWEVTSFG